MNKYFNPTYTKFQYETERNLYFEMMYGPVVNDLRQFSIDFCIRFQELLPSDESAIDMGFKNDDCDYAKWGYALYEYGEEKENEGHEVWKWINVYERLIDCELPGFQGVKQMADWLENLEL